MILIWGIDGDGPTDAIRDVLDAFGTDYLFANQREAQRIDLHLKVDSCGYACGHIRLGRRKVTLNEVTGFYVRPYASQAVGSALTPAQLRHAKAIDEQLSVFADLCDGYVLNPPLAMASNQSKPYQLDIIRRHGFETPDTLLTTDKEAASAFWRNHDEVIYKSISGTRSVVRRLQQNEASRLDDVAHAPTQFQEYVSGRDYRVHVIGKDCFATAIDSGADDYRYAQRQGFSSELEPVDLPTHIAGQCMALSHDLGLQLSGIDLRNSRDGRWYCFEVNPSPAFTFYEENTGQQLAAAIGRLLDNGNHESRHDVLATVKPSVSSFIIANGGEKVIMHSA